jgi:hypothetical protein
MTEVLARAAIRRLRTGLVPYWELDRLSVGYGRLKQVVDEGFDGLLGGGTPGALFIRGEWGSGKTHFLSFVRGIARSRDLPAARVDLNARSAALNYPQRFYSSIAESVCTAERAGLRAILSELLQDTDMRNRLRAFASSGRAGDLYGPLHVLVARYESGEYLESMDDPAWSILYGADLSWADYGYKREQATARIGSLARLFATVGMGGLVVVFDETETIDQLWNIRSRMSAYRVLGQLCRLDAVWQIFGITERFDRTLKGDADRGVLQFDFATEDAVWFLKAWQREAFTVLEPPGVDARNAQALASRIAKLYESAYSDIPADGRLIDRCVEEWLKNPSRNPRRLIRILIHRLDVSRQFDLPN